MSSRKYKLTESKEIVEVKDLIEWANWYEFNDRVVKSEHYEDFFISTIFIGLDHNFGNYPTKKPILFETMIFDGKSITERYCQRHHTYIDALIAHDEIVAKLQDGTLELFEVRT